MVTGNGTAGLNMNEEGDRFSEIRGSLSLITGHYIIIGALLFFQFVNWISKSLGPPKSLNDDNESWKWRNLIVSFVHSTIAAVWVLSSTFYYPELYWDLSNHISRMTFYCVCFSEGYFLYDMMDLIVNKKFWAHWELALHHITIIVMFYYNLHIRAHIGFSIVALSVEINSVFLHCRKLLQMVRTSYDSTKYLTVKYLNILTFIVFRGGALVTISSGVFLLHHTVSTLYLVGISITAFVMDVLNAVLFYRILKSDLFRGKRRSSSKVSKVGGASSENDHFTNNHVIVGNNNWSEDTVKSRKSGHQ